MENDKNSILENGTEMKKSDENIGEKKAKEFFVSNDLFTMLMLVAGIILVVLSGIIFATTTWKTLPPVIKFISILVCDAVFFILSQITRSRFKLEKTAASFYILGILFIPVTVTALGFYGLMGEWFSFEGSNIYMVFSTASFVFSAACCLSYKKYSSRIYFSAALAALTAAFIFMLFRFDSSGKYLPMGSLVYTIASLAVLPAVGDDKNRKLYKLFVYISTIIMSIIALQVYDGINLAVRYTDVQYTDILKIVVCINIFAVFAVFELCKKYDLGIRFIHLIYPAVTCFYCFSKNDLLCAVLTVVMVAIIVFNNPRRNEAKICGGILIWLVYIIVAPLESVTKMNYDLLCYIVYIASAMFVTIIVSLNEGKLCAVEKSLLLNLIITSVLLKFINFQDTFYILASALVLAYSIGRKNRERAGSVIICVLFIFLLTGAIETAYNVINSFDRQYISDFFEITVICSSALLSVLVFELVCKKLKAFVNVFTDYAVVVITWIMVFFGSLDLDDYRYLFISLLIALAVYIIRRRRLLLVNQIGIEFCIFVCMAALISSPPVPHIDFMRYGLPSLSYNAYVLLPLLLAGLAKPLIWKNHKNAAFGAALTYCSVFVVLNAVHAIGNDGEILSVLLILAVYFGLYAVLRYKGKRYNFYENILFTVAALTAAASLSINNPFNVPKVLVLEFFVLPYVIWILSLKLFWDKRHYSQTLIDIIIYTAAVYFMLLLGIDAFSGGNPIDVVIIGTISLAIMAYAYVSSSIRWFVLSAVSITLIVVKMTSALWSSMAWWVYLFTAGLIFIALAAAGEYNKKHERVLTGGIKAFLRKWKW